ncbi:MAG: outer membrane lipoprotein carrier protein LolA [Mariprofundaceae bacterium]|nr:outer membrane lipoprotein carrier protein LolA [Mariprofundaceae bacterium]
MNKKIMMAVMCCFACVLMGASSIATAGALPKALQEGLNMLAQTQGFTCEFEQTIVFTDEATQVYGGTLAVARPGRFRWQYTKPYEQLYISNGEGVWLYEPDLMQAQWLQGLESVDPVVMRLLNGDVKSEEITLLGSPGEKYTYHIRIGDKQDVWLSLADGMPAWLESRDALDNRNRITLKKIIKHQPDEALFHFDVPKGVDVISTAVSAAGGLNE